MCCDEWVEANLGNAEKRKKKFVSQTENVNINYKLKILKCKTDTVLSIPIFLFQIFICFHLYMTP